jgi:hypothetical protein
MPFPRVSRKDSTEGRYTEWLGAKVWPCAGAYLCSDRRKENGWMKWPPAPLSDYNRLLTPQAEVKTSAII